MAEFVQQKLEGMLPELEEMEQRGIFTKPEIRSIIKRRTDFEYRLQKRVVQKADFLRYMQFEINLDNLRKRRKLKSGIKKCTTGELASMRRLHSLFEKALKKFVGDLKLWLQYIEFCKQKGSNKVLGSVFVRVLQVHPSNPSLWVMAAKWEFEDNKSISTARSLLLRGLRMNPNSKMLWLEYFRMELLHVDKVHKRRQVLGLSEIEENDDVPVTTEFLEGKAAEIVFQKAIQALPDDVGFRLSFLQIYQIFDFTKTARDKVYRSLLQDFPSSEEAWDALARRPINELKESDRGTRIIADVEWCDVETEQDELYQQATDKVPTGKMWDCYINASMEILENSSTTQATRRTSNVLEVFKTAEKKKMLSAEMFVKWKDTLLRLGNATEALSVCKRGLRAHSSSLPLWTEYLTFKVRDGQSSAEELQKDFSQAIESVAKKDSLPLWNLWLDWSCLCDRVDVESVFEKSLLSCPEVAMVMRERYVDWTAITKGIKETRKLYKGILQRPPVERSFFRKCIELERSQVPSRVKRLRGLFEEALDRHGNTDPDLWLDYIDLELRHPDGTPQKTGQIHWRAMKTLSGHLTAEFVSKYSLLQAGHGTRKVGRMYFLNLGVKGIKVDGLACAKVARLAWAMKAWKSHVSAAPATTKHQNENLSRFLFSAR